MLAIIIKIFAKSADKLTWDFLVQMKYIDILGVGVKLLVYSCKCSSLYLTTNKNLQTFRGEVKAKLSA